MLGNLLDSNAVKESVLSMPGLSEEERRLAISALEERNVFDEASIMSFTLKMKLAKLFPIIGPEKAMLISSLIDENIEHLLLEREGESITTQKA